MATKVKVITWFWFYDTRLKLAVISHSTQVFLLQVWLHSFHIRTVFKKNAQDEINLLICSFIFYFAFVSSINKENLKNGGYSL